MKKCITVFSLITLLFLILFILSGCSLKQKVNKRIDLINESYTVVFNGNGGTLVSGDETQIVTKPEDIVPPTYEREGFTFTGFNRDLTTVKSDSLILAQWEENNNS